MKPNRFISLDEIRVDIFIVIPLYCWDIKPVFTQNVPAFRK